MLKLPNEEGEIAGIAWRSPRRRALSPADDQHVIVFPCEGGAAAAVVILASLSLYVTPQSRISIRIGSKLLPNSVREYSTFGGTWRYTSRWTTPSSSSSRSCKVSIR